MKTREYLGDFTVELKRNGAELNAEIKCQSCHNNAQYYFYLVKDGLVMDQQGWFTENSYHWTLQETGVYFVQGYVRVGDESELRQSNEVIYITVHQPVSSKAISKSVLPTKVSIFGSCTSRDLFRLYPSKDLELCSYVARQSVVSAVSAPVPLKLDEIALTSPFQKMAVWRDFNKTTFDLFREDGSDWLIIDLIDERFPPVRQGNSYVTKSAMAVEAGLIPENTGENIRYWSKKPELKRKDQENIFGFLKRMLKGNLIKNNVSTDVQPEQILMIQRTNIRTYIVRFAEKLLEIYKPNHIIIHRALPVKQYWNSDGKLCEFSEDEKVIGKIINDIIVYMYDLLKECIPEAHVIDCISRYHGSEQHNWGKAMVHYEDGYYAEVMSEVKNIVLSECLSIMEEYTMDHSSSTALQKYVANIEKTEQRQIFDFFVLAQDCSEHFYKDLNSEYYQFENVQGLNFYTSDRLEQLREHVKLQTERYINSSEKVVWIRAFFETRTCKTSDENEKYQKLNWILEEIYGQLEKIPQCIPCDLGMVKITSNSVEQILEQFYQEKEQNIKIFLEEISREKIGWFDVLTSLNGKRFSSEIRLKYKPLSKVTYAFYLIRDTKIIDKQDWSNDPTFVWELEESGIYVVPEKTRVSPLSVILIPFVAKTCV